ncbi:unnamed protein product [Protopolystoma xenopodis]|uniref:Uncharacterized protein n=1 Tax=Protopolystoma xenopodis TaxID=117903 RepID=A0A448XCH3_9PLAT|nr:unnamed protein product [Protopolystoma xenopodis]
MTAIKPRSRFRRLARIVQTLIHLVRNYCRFLPGKMVSAMTGDTKFLVDLMTETVSGVPREMTDQKQSFAVESMKAESTPFSSDIRSYATSKGSPRCSVTAP